MRRITCPTNYAFVLFCMLFWAPIASGQQTLATGTPQLVAGTTVVVRIVDAADSGSDPAGKQYRASVASPVNAGSNITIAQGSVATITLVRNASGWEARLNSLFINGRVTPVDGSLAALAGTSPHSLDNDVAVLTGHASGTTTVAGLAAVASGARIILPSGTSLSFVLDAPAANGLAPANPAQANASVLAANQPGRSYYCTFNGTVQRPNITHYFSGVFQADASQIEVSKAWTNYIRQNYLPGDNRDSGSCQLGTADQQQRVESTLRQTWQAMATGSEGAGRRNIPTNTAVDVSWKYVPDHPSASSAAGTPPSTAAASVAPPASAVPGVPASQPLAAQPTAQGTSTAARPGGPAQGQKQRETFCSATYSPDNSPVTHYRSDVFQFTGGNPAVPGALPGTIEVAWRSYLVKTYHIPVNNYILIQCFNLFNDPAGQRTTASKEQSWKGDKGEVIHVDWKYTPDQLAPSAAAASTAQRTSGAVPGQGGPAQAQKQQGGEWWWYCTAGPYMTGVFSYPADAMRSAEVDSAIQAAWGNHVKKTYANLALGSGCTEGGPDQALTQRSHDHMRASQGEGGVFDVDWKYTPDQTATVALGKGKPSYCSGAPELSGGNLYISDIFGIPPNTPLYPVINDFAQFVFEKYGERIRGVTCPSSTNMEADKQYMRQKNGYKIVETGWKPKSLPPPNLGP